MGNSIVGYYYAGGAWLPVYRDEIVAATINQNGLISARYKNQAITWNGLQWTGSNGFWAVRPRPGSDIPVAVQLPNSISR